MDSSGFNAEQGGKIWQLRASLASLSSEQKCALTGDDQIGISEGGLKPRNGDGPRDQILCPTALSTPRLAPRD
jgi:hypothetical protein